MIIRAFALSSAGTTCQGDWRVLVGSQAVLVRFHVIVPVFSFLDIAAIEFPVLVRLVDPRKEPFALFLLGNMEKELTIRVALRCRCASRS